MTVKPERKTFEMASESSNLSAASKDYLFLDMSRRQNDYPDYPQTTDYSSIEDYDEAVKKYFKSKGFRHADDFSDDEKNAIVEDCAINLISPNVLSRKYNTMPYVICNFVILIFVIYI